MTESTRTHTILKIWCFILALALLVTGLFFTVGGAKLVTLGGSWYFVISGVFTLASAIFIFKKKRSVSGYLVWFLWAQSYGHC